jgi:signal transduction histidine kinase/CheY-like chemotaxis protein
MQQTLPKQSVIPTALEQLFKRFSQKHKVDLTFYRSDGTLLLNFSSILHKNTKSLSAAILRQSLDVNHIALSRREVLYTTFCKARVWQVTSPVMDAERLLGYFSFVKVYGEPDSPPQLKKSDDLMHFLDSASFQPTRGLISMVEELQDQITVLLQCKPAATENKAAFILDKNDRIFAWNQGMVEIFSIKSPSIVGSSFSQLLYREHKQRWQDAVRQFRRNKEPLSVSVWGVNRDGEVIRLGTRFLQDNSLGRGFIQVKIEESVQISISHLQKIHSVQNDKEDIKPTRKASQHFLPRKSIAHFARHLETQLSAIATQFSSVSPVFEGKFHSRFFQIHKQMNKSFHLLQPLLDLDIRIGKKVPFDLKDLLYKAAGQQQQFFQDRFHFHFECEAESFMVDCDPPLLFRALQYLIHNAREAISEGGDIRISLSPTRMSFDSSDQVILLCKLVISDSGEGISESGMEHIYTPFFTLKHGNHFGVGLSAAKHIIELHQGTVQVSSKPETGTKVIIYLPMLANQNHEGIMSKSQAGILIIEDEEDLLKISTIVLQQEGYQLFTSRTAKQALHIMQENIDTIRVVVLDIMLPDMDGLECAEKLRKIKPDISFIVSSGWAPSKRYQPILDRKGRWLQKPYPPEDLASAVKKSL